MSGPLHILHLENDYDDAELVRLALERSGVACEVKVAPTREAFLEGLDGPVDLVLSDSAVPGLEARSALAWVERHRPDVPFLLVSGASPEVPGLGERYVPKSELSRLGNKVREALANGGAAARGSGWGGYGEAAERLVTAVRELALARDLPTLQAVVRRAARDLTGADGATFVLREGDLCYYADEEAIAPLWKGQRFPISACISGWTMQQRRAAVIEDIYADPRIPVDAYRPTFVKSLALVPIRRADPVGAIGNYWAQRHLASVQEVRLLQALADSTAVALENLQLYQGLEARVAERTAQLEAANAELESFSFSVSHDLRSPLRIIEGFSEFLLDDAAREGLGPQTVEHLQRISRASKRVNQLIEDLLKLSSVTRMELRPLSVDLSAMAREIAADLQAADPQRACVFEIAPELRATGDERLLRTVMENLLSNAWKYTIKEAEARISFSRQGGQPHGPFVLRDNGVGFDRGQAGRLFGAFQRLHSAQEFPGTGVGLAAVKRILHRHGGRIWAESAPGEGAAFLFTLPD